MAASKKVGHGFEFNAIFTHDMLFAVHCAFYLVSVDVILIIKNSIDGVEYKSLEVGMNLTPSKYPNGIETQIADTAILFEFDCFEMGFDYV